MSDILIDLGAVLTLAAEVSPMATLEVACVPGPPGPPGPPGGPTVIAVPYDEWPPVSPQPDILYLRLAP